MSLVDYEGFDDSIFDLPVDDQPAPTPAVSLVPPVVASEPVVDDDDAIVDNMPATGLVELRDYQRRAVDAVLKEFENKAQSTLVVSATGTGKTVIMSELARRANAWNHGVLWLCHRDELIRQGARSLARVGIHALIEKAGEDALPGFGMLSKTVVASVPTLRGERLTRWSPDTFRLIISDECHHAIASTWTGIVNHFGNARHVGFTATADRLDGANIGRMFETLAFEYNLRHAVNDNWLVPIEALPIQTDPPIDLADLRVVAGDFNQGDLEKVIQDNIGVLVNAIVDKNALEDRRTIAFTPDVKSAQALAAALNDVGIRAEWIAGTSPDRADIIKRHQAGAFQVLVNCMILTEGYDDPQVACILICRPTKSRSLYSQMVGRGTRTYPDPFNNTKANCRIVDFAYLTGKHALVSPVDLYDDAETADEVVARAKEIIAEGKERNLDEAMERAQQEFDAAERVKIRRRQVSARAFKYDPLAVGELLGIRDKAVYNDWLDVRPASEKLKNGLRKFKVDVPDDIGHYAACKLMTACVKRAQLGLASVRQVKTCIDLGMSPAEARRTSFQDASAYITANKTW